MVRPDNYTTRLVSHSGIRALIGLTLGAFLSGQASAQEEVGAVHGTVRDTDGGLLPGASVSLEGLGAPRLQVTDERGAFHFVRLDPGQYRLEARLEGFSTVERPGIGVQLGQSTNVEVELPLAIGEVITVVTETPLLDERNISTGVSISNLDLDTIPVTRKVWAMASQVPGVLSDQLNVGGSDGGGLSTFRGPGIADSENTYQLDGVEVGDMTAVGYTPSHFDVHQFSEIQFRVSGADVTKPTAGVSINLVTKRGSNEFRGSARFYRTEDRFFGWQSSRAPIIEQPSDVLAPNQPSFVGNTVDQVDDYGLEAGGPALRDRLWFWGAYGFQDYRLRTGGTTVEDVQDEGSLFEYAALKINWQIASANSMVGTWNYGELKRVGLGAGLTRSPETSWNQRGPVDIYKLEDTHLFSSNLFLGGAYASVDTGFAVNSLACIAAGSCEAAPESLWDADGVWRRSFVSGFTQRTSEQLKLDGSYFFNAGSSNHELKFGGRLREYEVRSTFSWPGGRNLYIIDLGLFGVPGNVEWVGAQAGLDGPPASTEYTALWAQDTIALGRWTLNAGLRYDLQEGRNDAVVSPGSDTFPDALPDIEYAGGEAPFDWSTLVPRLGVTYAVGQHRKTLIRASYSQFAQQLGTSSIRHTNAAGLRYAYYSFLDTNENLEFDEEDIILGLDDCVGCPADDESGVSPNRIDPDFAPERVTEGLLEVQHSFLPELVVSANYLYRNRSDVNWERPLVELADGSIRAAVADDWQRDATVQVPLPDGTSTMVDVFSLRDSVIYTQGDLLTTSDRSVRYNGIGLTLTKRLSNQWMLRGFFQYGKGEWSVPDSFVARENPNPDGFANDVDGAPFGVRSGFGRTSNVFLQSVWSSNVNGMYQFAPDRPYGFNLAANLYARQGYPVPYYLLYDGGDGLGRQSLSILGGDLDRFRVDDIFTTDLRLEKEFATSSSLGLTFSVDIFNLFNSAAVVQRERRAGAVQRGTFSGSALYDWLDQTLAPRVWRLGVRINWR